MISLADVLKVGLSDEAWREIEEGVTTNVQGVSELDILVYGARLFLKHAIPAAMERKLRWVKPKLESLPPGYGDGVAAGEEK